MISEQLTMRLTNIQALSLDKMLTGQSKQSPFTLSRLNLTTEIAAPVEQIPEVHNPKWSTEDQDLINWVLNNFHKTTSTYFCSQLWDYLHQKLALGPKSTEAISGILQDGFRLLKREIEQNPKND